MNYTVGDYWVPMILVSSANTDKFVWITFFKSVVNIIKISVIRLEYLIVFHFDLSIT